MLICEVISRWGTNAEGLAINRQLGAKKKKSTDLFDVVMELESKIFLLLSIHTHRCLFPTLWWEKLEG
jgi:hypothetical protein